MPVVILPISGPGPRREKPAEHPKNATPIKLTMGPSVGQKKVAATMRDVEQLCPAFQMGKCQSKTECKQGRRRCGVVSKKGRVCGVMSHGASGCKMEKQAGS